MAGRRRADGHRWWRHGLSPTPENGTRSTPFAFRSTCSRSGIVNVEVPLTAPVKAIPTRCWAWVACWLLTEGEPGACRRLVLHRDSLRGRAPQVLGCAFLANNSLMLPPGDRTALSRLPMGAPTRPWPCSSWPRRRRTWATTSSAMAGPRWPDERRLRSGRRPACRAPRTLIGKVPPLHRHLALDNIDLFNILCIPDATRAQPGHPNRADPNVDPNAVFNAAMNYCSVPRLSHCRPPPFVNTPDGAVDGKSLG